MPITADAVLSVTREGLKPILDFIDTDPRYETLRSMVEEAGIHLGLIQITPIMRYNLSCAIRAKLASLDWFKEENETMKIHIRALRVVHAC